jgi:site-specific recombinase XerC
VGIDIDDINMKENYINVNEKGDINKKVYISDNTKDSLKRWIEDRSNMVDETERALFICQGNHRISTRSVERKFNKITQGTSKHITPHKMRATCATKLYEQTGDIYLVQQQLGHKNIENTKRYAKVSETKMREAANILDTAY